MTTEIKSFKGIDFEEIGTRISGHEIPAETESIDWVRDFITTQNVEVLYQFLLAHIEHVKNCHNTGAKNYLPIYNNIATLKGLDKDNEFYFLKAFSLNYPMMWC